MSGIVPRPRSWTALPGTLTLDATTTLAVSPRSAGAGLERVARWLRAELGAACGLDLPPAAPDAATLLLDRDDALPAEGFVLEVAPTGARVRGGDAAGVFYGLQALRQLLPAEAFARAQVGDGPWELACGVVEDEPRFAWRGVLLDVARHFRPLDDVLRFVDLLAMHRVNTLHLHLTDDQGWRVEIAGYPRLTEVGGWRRESQVGAGPDAPGDGRPHGGWYSRADVAQIVAYAADRFVTVVPEIDLPGHVQALVAAYPALGAGLDTGPDGGLRPPEVWTRWGISDHVLNVEESTITVLTDILDDVVAMFPSPVISLGGDESPKTRWHVDPRVRARREELRAEADVDRDADLQNWLLRRLADHLAGHGRRTVLWDEVLEGADVPGAVVASWRGERGVRVGTERGYDVVSCPADRVYLDYRQSGDAGEPVPTGVVTSVLDVYAFDPDPDPDPTGPKGGTRGRGRVLGAQAHLWTEHVDDARVLDYMAFPRLAAFAETVWSSRARDAEEFLERLDGHLRRLDARGVGYRQDDGPRPWQERPGVVGDPLRRDQLDEHLARMVSAFSRTDA